jgi:prepilin-type N-terminal cleavage/methylation domain-containing protein
MADIIRKRLTGREEGFTLIELLVVIVILGILLAIAVPSYMGFRDRAQKVAAEANVRAAVPSVEAYYQDNNSYSNLSTTILLASYDAGLKLDTANPMLSGASYCISSNGGGNHWASKNGPAGQIVSVVQAADPCP